MGKVFLMNGCDTGKESFMSRTFTNHQLDKVGNYEARAKPEGKMKMTFRLTVAVIALRLLAVCAASALDSAISSTAESHTKASKVISTNTNPVPSVTLTLGPPKQIFHLHQPDAMGMFNVPDMHTSVLMQPDKSYLVWITGDIGPDGKGSIAMLSTKDFLTYKNAGPGTSKKAEPVFSPKAVWQNYDADYVDANAVFTAANGKDLLMFYEAGNRNYGPNVHGPEYNVIALARSNDNGRTWTRQGPVISGTDSKPNTQSGAGTTQPGVSESGAIISDGHIYMFYQYIPNENYEPEAPSVIQVARAPIASDGAPGNGPNSTTVPSAPNRVLVGLGQRLSPLGKEVAVRAQSRFGLHSAHI
jgi:hypothetical protein